MPDKTRTPEFLRKLKGTTADIENGKVSLVGKKVDTKTGFTGKPHTNFTTDRPVVSHPGGDWSWGDLYIVSGDDVLNQTPKENLISIVPSDTFIDGNPLLFDPERVTLVTGNVDRLRWARDNGLQTLSSPKLRRIYKEHPKTKYALEYPLEIQRLQSTRGVPTYKDYLELEKRTGLNAGVAPISEKLNFDKWLDDMKNLSILADIKPYVYPNGEK